MYAAEPAAWMAIAFAIATAWIVEVAVWVYVFASAI